LNYSTGVRKFRFFPVQRTMASAVKLVGLCDRREVRPHVGTVLAECCAHELAFDVGEPDNAANA
jgi:hypothetical protein